MLEPKLTDKQKAFCHEYAIDKNATQAAIRAGYSEATAHQIAAENLRKPYVKAYLDELLSRQTEREHPSYAKTCKSEMMKGSSHLSNPHEL